MRRPWQAEATFVNGAKFTFGVHGTPAGVLLKSCRLLAEFPDEMDQLSLERLRSEHPQAEAIQADHPRGMHHEPSVSHPSTPAE